MTCTWTLSRGIQIKLRHRPSARRIIGKAYGFLQNWIAQPIYSFLCHQNRQQPLHRSQIFPTQFSQLILCAVVARTFMVEPLRGKHEFVTSERLYGFSLKLHILVIKSNKHIQYNWMY
jgi:hypothetical protein